MTSLLALIPYQSFGRFVDVEDLKRTVGAGQDVKKYNFPPLFPFMHFSLSECHEKKYLIFFGFFEMFCNFLFNNLSI
jgi:hypothetical protein